jgi:hypothetical protein
MPFPTPASRPLGRLIPLALTAAGALAFAVTPPSPPAAPPAREEASVGNRSGSPAPSPATFGTSGKAETVLAEGKEATLFAREGGGCLTHFWFGGNFDGVEETRIRYYVDGEKEPSIDMQLYMGHGIGFNDNQAPWATRRVGKIGKRNGIFNNYRIPFAKGIRVTAERNGAAKKDPMAWWIIRGAENLAVTLGGVTLPPEARLRLYRNESRVLPPLEEFDLCNAAGRGALFQVTIAAEGLETPNRMSYLEACMRGYFGGNSTPVLLSSGLEDYFLGTYYFDTGRFHADISGLTHIDPAKSRFSAYRFHDDDPVFFRDGLRLTCRNGETAHGTPEGPVAYKQPPATRFTTYTWVYQW